jgi:hypothetical protein
VFWLGGFCSARVASFPSLFIPLFQLPGVSKTPGQGFASQRRHLVNPLTRCLNDQKEARHVLRSRCIISRPRDDGLFSFRPSMSHATSSLFSSHMPSAPCRNRSPALPQKNEIKVFRTGYFKLLCCCRAGIPGRCNGATSIRI